MSGKSIVSSLYADAVKMFPKDEDEQVAYMQTCISSASDIIYGMKREMAPANDSCCGGVWNGQKAKEPEPEKSLKDCMAEMGKGSESD